MLNKSKLQRYQQLARLLIKYGRRDFIDAAGAELGTSVEEVADDGSDMPSPQELTVDLVELGPTFIKLAQMLSTRGDLLSAPFMDALSRLQDDVEAFEFSTVEQIVADELGAKLSSIYLDFDPTPIAAASLGQVHRATLRDGRPVAVKVQRPDIRNQLVEDLEILQSVAGAVDRRTELGRKFQFSIMVEQFQQALMLELDYRQEARNLDFFANQLEEFKRLVVPRPVSDLTAERVLTMEFVSGRSVGQLGGLARVELDLRPLVKELCNAYLHQILIAGCFHCDPHPGNLLLTDDGKIALIDLGMVAYVDPQLRTRLLRLLMALCDGRGEETAELGIELGERLADANINQLTMQVSDLVARRRNRAEDGRKLGQTLLDLVRIFATHGVRPPPLLGLLGKTLLTLDSVAHELDPDFDPDEAFNDYAHNIMRQLALKQLDPSKAFTKMLDVHGFAEKLPRRVAGVLDSLSNGELSIKVDAVDEDRLLSALEKIGNRIALGLVIAALIVGAALVMPVKTEWTLFGYPALAIVLFLTAVVVGFAMVVKMLLSDRR